MSALAERPDGRPLIVITDSDFGDHAIESDVLEPAFRLLRCSGGSAAEVIEVAREAVALLVQWAPIDGQVIDSLQNLKVVVRYGIGLDNIDLKAAEQRGVLVRNVDDYCLHEVADHAAAAIGAANRRLSLYDAVVKRGEWSPRCLPAPLIPAEDPVGIAGYGRIGALLAAKLAARGHPLIVWDPYAAEQIARDGPAQAADLQTLAEQVNHLSLHIPLTKQTEGIVDEAVLEALGPHGHLVNHARGGLLDEVAVLSWLDQHEFASASLDVFVHEPPTDLSLKLAHHSRVSASPHVAYLSTQSLPRLRRSAAEHVLEALQG